jgi:hypothetical protein
LAFLFSRFALLALMAASGCVARYHEPARSKNSPSIHANAPLWVTSIDGKKVSQVSISGEKQFRVSPGPHVLRIRLSDEERQQFMCRTNMWRMDIIG